METQLNVKVTWKCLISPINFSDGCQFNIIKMWSVIKVFQFKFENCKKMWNASRFCVSSFPGGGSSLSIETNRNNWNNWNTFEIFRTKLKKLEQNLKQVVSPLGGQKISYIRNFEQLLGILAPQFFHQKLFKLNFLSDCAYFFLFCGVFAEKSCFTVKVTGRIRQQARFY